MEIKPGQKSALVILGYWLLLLALAGCGYRPLGSETPLSPERRTLAIPLFANRSTEVGLEALLANAFVQAFSENKSLRITSRPEEADLVLEGKVTSVEHSSVAYVDITRSLVRRVTVKVDLNLRQRKSGKTIWKDSAVFQDDYVIPTSTNISEYQMGEVTRAMGLRRAAVNLARQVLDKVLLVI
jgi:hypothetical protein